MLVAHTCLRTNTKGFLLPGLRSMSCTSMPGVLPELALQARLFTARHYQALVDAAEGALQQASTAAGAPPPRHAAKLASAAACCQLVPAAAPCPPSGSDGRVSRHPAGLWRERRVQLCVQQGLRAVRCVQAGGRLAAGARARRPCQCRLAMPGPTAATLARGSEVARGACRCAAASPSSARRTRPRRPAAAQAAAPQSSSRSSPPSSPPPMCASGPPTSRARRWRPPPCLTGGRCCTPPTPRCVTT